MPTLRYLGYKGKAGASVKGTAINTGSLLSKLKSVEDDARVPEQPVTDPNAFAEFGKGILRGGEGVLGSMGALTQWAGEAIGARIPGSKYDPFEWIGRQGKQAREFWQRESQRGMEAIHPSLIPKGKGIKQALQVFKDRPAAKIAATVGEALPTLALGYGAGSAAMAAKLTTTAATWVGAGTIGAWILSD